MTKRQKNWRQKKCWRQQLFFVNNVFFNVKKLTSKNFWHQQVLKHFWRQKVFSSSKISRKSRKTRNFFEKKFWTSKIESCKSSETRFPEVSRRSEPSSKGERRKKFAWSQVFTPKQNRNVYLAFSDWCKEVNVDAWPLYEHNPPDPPKQRNQVLSNH